MRHSISAIILSGLFFLSLTSQGQDNINSKVEDLISRMTLEEKVGQMTNIGLTALTKGPFYNDIDSLEIDTAKMNHLLLKYHVGSVQNKGKYPPGVEEWNRLTTMIQKTVVEESRLRIPVLFGIDGVHGATYTASSTIFPHQIACAATWDPAHAYTMGEITSYELRASSLLWNYAPVLDISYQPLWGRIYESFGEDTYLTTQMGNAFVMGSQGESVSEDTKVAVCLKHFIGYGSPYNGKDRSNSVISERDLHQYFLPPFEEAIKLGAKSVMLNSGAVNGIPGHINSHWINNILKAKMGFEGVVLSDWDDITKLVEAHNVAATNKEAVKLAVLAGLDICMDPYDESFAVNLAELVREGEVPMERVDDAVRRILKLKFELGLFDDPYTDYKAYDKFGSADFVNASYEAAKECITLLKNEEKILPLSKSTKVLVTGPTSNSINYLNGAWSRTWSGVETEYNDPGKLSILEAVSEKIGENNTLFEKGAGIDEELDIDKAVELANQCEVIIACLGERPATEKPSDTDDLDLPDAQIKLIEELSKAGKPIVLILVEGRPRVFSKIEGLTDAVVMAYLPGQEGGRAIADILFGDHNPSGRLPYTYPRHSGSIWKYNHKGADAMARDFSLNGFDPQYEFGEGYSYTEFSYSDLWISHDTISPGDSVQVNVSITNTGDMTGKEVVQLYTRDMVASISPDVKRLARFTKIELKPGETRSVSFTLHTRDLAFVGMNNEWITEPGDFQLMIGGNPKELQTIGFYLEKE